MLPYLLPYPRQRLGMTAEWIWGRSGERLIRRVAIGARDLKWEVGRSPMLPALFCLTVRVDNA